MQSSVGRDSILLIKIVLEMTFIQLTTLVITRYKTLKDAGVQDIHQRLRLPLIAC